MEYNRRNPAVKRLMREAEELRNPSDELEAYPMEDNLFDWHFTIRGPANTDFHGGMYHGRIILPPEYPMKPPNIMLLTPNGRFEVNKKICLNISGHHPESWQPSWSIRTALLAIIGFMPTHGNGAIGSLDYSPEERQQLALRSHNWKCPKCGLLKKLPQGKGSTKASSHKLTERQDVAQLTHGITKDSDSPSELEVTASVENPPANGLGDGSKELEMEDEPNSVRRRESEGEQPPTLRQRVTCDSLENTISNEPHANQENKFMEYCSWICIRMIILILVALFFRRLLYQ